MQNKMEYKIMNKSLKRLEDCVASIHHHNKLWCCLKTTLQNIWDSIVSKYQIQQIATTPQFYGIAIKTTPQFIVVV